VIIENAPPRLRGRLSLWLAEIGSGCYVGRVSKKQKANIVDLVVDGIGTGSAIVVWQSNNDAGFEFWSCGAGNRRPISVDGMTLVAYKSSTSMVGKSDTGGKSE